MTSTSIGRQAESRVVDYLLKRKYDVIARNWRTRYCEIDIVAVKDRTVYFIEVKYRSSNDNGSGFDYITPKKIKQMKFAAEMWLASEGWEGDAELLACEVDASNIVQISSLEGY